MDLRTCEGTVFVTEAGSGIGKNTARSLASEGARVALNDRNIEAAEAVASELRSIGADAFAFQADTSDETSTSTAVNCVVDCFGDLDYLVLCAGSSNVYGKSMQEITVTQWDNLLGVNVRGQWLTAKYALPALRNSTRHPAIAIVASDSALCASLRHTPYVVSTGAVVMLAKALAVDLRDDNIRVNCVCPSVVDTAQRRQDFDVQDVGYAREYPVHRPEEIARYLTLLISTITRTTNAHPLVADFGYSAQSGFPA